MKRVHPYAAGIAAIVALLALPIAASAADHRHTSPAKPTVVLVHGAWADGSSWDGVVKVLQADGYTVDVPPNPLRGLAADSAYLKDYLGTISGPVVLVGHSYGGAVISDAATGDSNVKALVYVDAFIPDRGESLMDLLTPKNPDEPGPNPEELFNFVPFPDAPNGVADLYLKPQVLPGRARQRPPGERGRGPRGDPTADRLQRLGGKVRDAGLEDDPFLGCHRHRRPPHPTAAAGIHG